MQVWEGASGGDSERNGGHSYGAQCLPRWPGGCCRARVSVSAPRPQLGPPGTARHQRRGDWALYLSPHTLSAPRLSSGHRRQPLRGAGATRSAARPGPLAPRRSRPTPRGRHSCRQARTTPTTSLVRRPPSRAPTLSGASDSAPSSPHTEGPLNVLGESGEGGNRPLAVRFLLFPPSHLPPNLLPTPPSRPPGPSVEPRGPPPSALLPPSALAAWPVRPQPWAGCWAAAAAEAARSTIVLLTLSAPTLRLFPFLPHHRHSPPSFPPHPQPAALALPDRLPAVCSPARSSGGLGAVSNATGF